MAMSVSILSKDARTRVYAAMRLWLGVVCICVFRNLRTQTLVCVGPTLCASAPLSFLALRYRCFPFHGYGTLFIL